MISYGDAIAIKCVCNNLPKSTKDFIGDLVNEAKQKPQFSTLLKHCYNRTMANGLVYAYGIVNENTILNFREVFKNQLLLAIVTLFLRVNVPDQLRKNTNLFAVATAIASIIFVEGELNNVYFLSLEHFNL
ncbi:hypothetical protein MaMV-DH010039 [Cyanophage MaMV-DH01]|nr:hypothetical protein MaMV-DH010039 [Cyanophage MaMV-DH01]